MVAPWRPRPDPGPSSVPAGPSPTPTPVGEGGQQGPPRAERAGRRQLSAASSPDTSYGANTGYTWVCVPPLGLKHLWQCLHLMLSDIILLPQICIVIVHSVGNNKKYLICHFITFGLSEFLYISLKFFLSRYIWRELYMR